ncbi:hypothetical protein TURU_019127 [Turdus rufiventris]|nr:hypothetical protein TURU_019127 [Turdus rufiventris]
MQGESGTVGVVATGQGKPGTSTAGGREEVGESGTVMGKHQEGTTGKHLEAVVKDPKSNDVLLKHLFTNKKSPVDDVKVGCRLSCSTMGLCSPILNEEVSGCKDPRATFTKLPISNRIVGSRGLLAWLGAVRVDSALSCHCQACADLAQRGASAGSHFRVGKFLNFVHILASLEYKLHFRFRTKILVKMVWLIIVKLL